ncbi:IgGFc-binding protein-like [Protopterus annectens]|uniref:IgGFc-binding protein-like n=1 Tax=Protopterus annectens TaxID=7888 RepID=UPI001CFB5284|nr:IgGFc-binding protein-like [Protopterus annectens]XP_043919356.1 IgGFc-binding protein-like [Protopterus annectens]
MNYIIALICLLTSQLHEGVCWNSEGTEFITAFMQSLTTSMTIPDFRLAITALQPSTTVRVIIYNRSSEIIRSLEEQVTITVPIPTNTELQGTVLSSRNTIIVRSDKPVTVVSYNYKSCTADSATIFPVNTLGTEYYIFAPIKSIGSPEFTVINYNQTNEIHVMLTGFVTYNGTNYRSGDNVTIILSAFEAVQLQSNVSLTGTRIMSQYPIAVVSGNNCDKYYTYCDLLFEQLIPLKDWGKTFLVSSLAVQNYNDTVTIIASQTTEIQYTTGGMSSNIILQKGNYSEIILLPNYSLVITATQPVMVMYTFVGGEYNGSLFDPFIMNIIPSESFSNFYIINTEIHVNNYVRVIAKNSVLLESFSGNNTVLNTSKWNFMTGTEYAWTNIVIGSDNKNFTLQQCSPFAAYIYGIKHCIGIGTTAPAVNRTPHCADFNVDVAVTVTSLANGSIQVNWTKNACADSYLLQLFLANNLSLLEEKIVNGSSFLFIGPYNHSLYNLRVRPMLAGETCLPQEEQFIHLGKRTTVIAQAFVDVIGRNLIDPAAIAKALENKTYFLLNALSPYIKVRVKPAN